MFQEFLTDEYGWDDIEPSLVVEYRSRLGNVVDQSAESALRSFVENSSSESCIYFYQSDYKFSSTTRSEALKHELTTCHLIVLEESFSELAEFANKEGLYFEEIKNAVVPSGIVLAACGSKMVSYGSKTPEKLNRSLSLRGGISVDTITNSFLAGYPPTQLLYRGVEVAPQEKIEINDIAYTVKDFFESLPDKSEELYTLRYAKEKFALDFCIKSQREIIQTWTIGFPLQEQFLSLKLESVEDGGFGYFHNNIKLPNGFEFFSEEDTGLLIDERELLNGLLMPEHRWIVVEKGTAKRFRA